jgi:hypothetical protein
MTARSTVLLVSPERAAAGALVWAHRNLFTPVEVHVRDEGSFLTAERARPVVPWAEGGLGYAGTLLDALEADRVDLVVSLVEPGNGTLPGFWEFLGVSFVGYPLTGMILASERPRARSRPGASVPVALVGGPHPRAVSPGGPEAEAAAQEEFLDLGLEGWALASVSPGPTGWQVDDLELHPDLAASGFLPLWESHGGSLEGLLQSLLEGARERQGREAALKHHYRDRI